MGAGIGHWSIDHSPTAKPWRSKACGFYAKHMFGLHNTLTILCKPCQNEKTGLFPPSLHNYFTFFSLFWIKSSLKCLFSHSNSIIFPIFVIFTLEIPSS